MAKDDCDDCIYRSFIEGGKLSCCNYFLMTDQRRPCPPGDGCTVKISREVKRRKKKASQDKPAPNQNLL